MLNIFKITPSRSDRFFWINGKNCSKFVENSDWGNMNNKFISFFNLKKVWKE